MGMGREDAEAVLMSALWSPALSVTVSQPRSPALLSQQRVGKPHQKSCTTRFASWVPRMVRRPVYFCC